MIRFAQKGMTLIEITVVLLVLIALAGLVVPYVGGTSRKALCDATDVSMANIKRAIMERYFLDTLGQFPVDKGNTDYSLHYLFSIGDGAGTDWSAFDPDTQVGWRGPYLQNSITLNAADAGALDGSFKDAAVFDPNTDHVHLDLANNQSVVFDAWGRPIILQVHINYGSRLVSAGPGSGFGLGNAPLDTVVSGNRGGDDRVLYLQNMPAGEQNESCSN